MGSPRLPLRGLQDAPSATSLPLKNPSWIAPDVRVIGTVDADLDRGRLADLQRAKDRVEETCAPCALRARCQSHCGCQHWALTGELGRINAVLCEIEESFVTAADHAASALLAEGCPSFIATYYRKRYRPAPGAGFARLRRSRET